MSDELTPRLNLPLIGDHAQKKLVLNEALMRLESLVQARAISRATIAQPTNPSDGDSYILPLAPSGAEWSGFAAGTFVRFDSGIWEAIAIPDGALVHVEDETSFIVRSGSAWVTLQSLFTAFNGLLHLGIGTIADSSNVLAVKGAAALLSGRYAAEGGSGDVSLALNKEGDSGTAQLLWQKDYSTRVLLGLTGDNHLSLRVSPDGSSFTTALTIDSTTAKASATWGLHPPCWPMKSLLGAGGVRLGPPGRGANSNGSVVANRLYMMPVLVPYDMTLTRISVRVTTGAAGNVRLGIYCDDGGKPGALLLDAGASDTSIADIKEKTIALDVKAGWYWLAALFDATPTCNLNSALAGDLGMSASSTTSAPVIGYFRSFTYAALPADESAQTYSASVSTATGTPTILIG